MKRYTFDALFSAKNEEGRKKQLLYGFFGVSYNHAQMVGMYFLIPIQILDLFVIL